MKLKKTVASIFAAVAIVGSMFAPVSADTTIYGTAEEDGEFTAPAFTSSFSFPAALIQWQTGQTVTSLQQYLYTGDTRAYSPGWSISMSATDFEDGNGHKIPVSNLSVRDYSFAWYWTRGCPNINPVPDNPYQKMTRSGGSFADGDVVVLTATAGRGCSHQEDRGIRPTYYFDLHVPPGTYTGGDSAQYTSTLTLTTNHNPAPGAAD